MSTRPMRIRAAQKDGVTEVRVLMSHIMETGLRKDGDGNVVPAHFIQDVVATCNDKEVLRAQWGPAVARDPFLSFKFKGGNPGDEVKITWIDNTGATRTDTAEIR
ncbi:MAG TPA: thiosulfate oxidation carrier complex protein SoxZ [Burkholderiaceae bacterium]|nr:thiosulfate oxidation carrier complex protein SoxZ [Burkholderiaceae bacterium]